MIDSFHAETEERKAQVEAIFEEVDIDGSGEIQFSEWIVAAIDKQSLITEEKLKLAFQLFDKDGGGTIQSKEVKGTLLGSEDVQFSPEEEEFWNSIIDEVDLDGNGEIDFEEFAYMIRKIVIPDKNRKRQGDIDSEM